MNTSDELRHLLKGVEPGEKAKGLGIALFKVNCPGDANNVLKRCQEVLEIVLRQDNKNWPSDDKWQILLPEWFVARCAPERTLEEEEQLLELWQKLSPEEQRIASSEEQWAISEWIYWFQPEERQWFWWDAFAESDNVFTSSC